MSISFESHDGGCEITVTDQVERNQCVFSINGPGGLGSPSNESAVPFAIDSARTLTARALSTTTRGGTFVHDSETQHREHLTPPTTVRFHTGTYWVELDGPIKLYLGVPAPFSVDLTADRFTIERSTTTEFVIAARSHHHRPGATVTTTDDPTDVMAAVASFSSALKTTTCERSYPSLRGHPPLLERGESLSIPDHIERPDTGVRIELPPDLGTVVVAAPLAYYLGADLAPGTHPRIVAENGYTYRLDGEFGYERTVERVLKQVFVFDCITRTEGRYDVDLYERERIEPLVDLDFPELYDRPLAEQVAAYLEEPFETIRPFVPRWAAAAFIDPTPERLPVLPFVVDDLSVVRLAAPQDLTPGEIRSAMLAEYVGAGAERPEGPDAGEPRPSSHDARIAGSAAVDGGPHVVRTGNEATAESWFGDYIPVGGGRGLHSAYRNGLDRQPASGGFDVAVVCNAPAEDEHESVVETYRSTDETSLNVDLFEDTTSDELRAITADDYEFLHYIGHVDRDGFVCSDDTLDAAGLDSVGVDAFVLNACYSYHQGVALVDAGALGGVVTFNDVVTTGAATIGRTIARLLEFGFPLQAALSLARSKSVTGGQYIVVGDGRVHLTQDEHGMPMTCDITVTDDGFEVVPRTYLPAEGGMGSLAYPYIGDNEQYYLGPGSLKPFHLTRTELLQFLSWFEGPISVDSSFYWAEDVGDDIIDQFES